MPSNRAIRQVESISSPTLKTVKTRERRTGYRLPRSPSAGVDDSPSVFNKFQIQNSRFKVSAG